MESESGCVRPKNDPFVSRLHVRGSIKSPTSTGVGTMCQEVCIPKPIRND